MKKYTVQGKVELFPQEGGWYFVRVPLKITEELKSKADRGLIPAKFTLGKTQWESSLLPMGNGTHFIALKAAVRKAEGVKFGKKVKISFVLR